MRVTVRTVPVGECHDKAGSATRSVFNPCGAFVECGVRHDEGKPETGSLLRKGPPEVGLSASEPLEDNRLLGVGNTRSGVFDRDFDPDLHGMAADPGVPGNLGRSFPGVSDFRLQ